MRCDLILGISWGHSHIKWKPPVVLRFDLYQVHPEFSFPTIWFEVALREIKMLHAIGNCWTGISEVKTVTLAPCRPLTCFPSQNTHDKARNRVRRRGPIWPLYPLYPHVTWIMQWKIHENCVAHVQYDEEEQKEREEEGR